MTRFDLVDWVSQFSFLYVLSETLLPHVSYSPYAISHAFDLSPCFEMQLDPALVWDGEAGNNGIGDVNVGYYRKTVWR